MKKIFIFFVAALLLPSCAYQKPGFILPRTQKPNNHYATQSVGNFDYVNGPNGYSGSRQKIGNTYYYDDNQGNNHASQSIGNFDYVNGSNGYSGSGQQIGNTYYYDDNQGNSFTTLSY